MAGLLINISEFVPNGVIFADEMNAAMAEMLIAGVAGAWLYSEAA